MMDLIMPSVSPTAPDAEEQVACELERIAPACHWTSGSWEGLGGLKSGCPRRIAASGNLKRLPFKSFTD
jgi:hypothetical protein